MHHRKLDDIERRILEHLMGNAIISNVDLSDRVGISASPCWRRVRELETSGVISNYVTLIDAASVGLTVSVFVNVSLEKQVERQLEVFQNAIRDRPEVMECYLMTGEADFLLRVVVPDLMAYERFLMDHLTRVPGIASIKSSFALKQVKYRTALPLDRGDAQGED